MNKQAQLSTSEEVVGGPLVLVVPNQIVLETDSVGIFIDLVNIKGLTPIDQIISREFCILCPVFNGPKIKRVQIDRADFSRFLNCFNLIRFK